MDSVAIRQLPASERPRERLWKLGARALSAAELIALVIGSGTRGGSALEVARSLVVQSDWLVKLARAGPEELVAKPGLGAARAAALVAAMELGRRSQQASPQGRVVRAPSDLARLAATELRDLRQERLIAIVLGPGHRLRRVVTVVDGWTERAQVPIREILSAVLRNEGVAFAVAHNHPSGDPTPSLADVEATRRLRLAANATGVRLLDHIVVGGTNWRIVRGAQTEAS